MLDTNSVCRQAIIDSSSLKPDFESISNYNAMIDFSFLRSVADVAAMGGGKDVLEIGFFTGVVSVSLARLGYRMTATDIPFVANDPAMRAFLEAEGILVVPHDLADIAMPFADASFDLIVFNEVLEHLPFNPIPLLREFRRIVRPGGAVYCATPNLSSLNNRLRLMLGKDVHPPVADLVAALLPDTGASVGLHWREWTKGGLIGLFAEADFHCAAHKYVALVANTAPFPRRQIKDLVYKLCPSLLLGQVGIFRAAEDGNLAGANDTRA